MTVDVQERFGNLLPKPQLDRLISFSKLNHGWGEKYSKALCKDSLDCFHQYLTNMAAKGYSFCQDLPDPQRMSIFMNSEGMVEINWYNEVWTLIHLTFINATDVEVFATKPNYKDIETKINVNHELIPYYRLTKDTIIQSKEEAMQ